MKAGSRSGAVSKHGGRRHVAGSDLAAAGAQDRAAVTAGFGGVISQSCGRQCSAGRRGSLS